jgi:hypothetical protein
MAKEESPSRREFLRQNATFGLGLSLFPSLLFANQSTAGRFTDHGVASPIGQHRGIVCATDADGRDVVLLWLFDHRGGYALLMIDAETGKSEQFAMPFPPGDAPYASILSSKNKFYSLFKGFFVEFDPVKRAFTAHHKTNGAAMAMTEDDNGRIWAISYPGSCLVSFDPATRQFVDYGFANKETWMQYPRFIAADDKGWVYFAVGFTSGQIVCFNPTTRETRTVYKENERKQGMAYVYRNQDGSVYGKALETDTDGWIKLYNGEVSARNAHSPNPVKYISDSQALFHRDFKSGKKIRKLDLTTNELAVTDPSTGTSREVKFTYTCDGAIVMGVALAPDNTICGGTAFPMRQFRFNPATREWQNFAAHGQFNTLESDGEHLYVGGYPRGFLLRWDTTKDFVPTQKASTTSNPRYLGAAEPDVYRPFRIFIHPDKDTIIYSGGPAYGHTGGGMVFWSKKKNTMDVLKDNQVIVDQSVMSLAVSQKGYMVGGTTTTPGSGGQKKAKEAVLFIMDDKSRKVIWNEALIPGVQGYNDLFTLPNGKIAGFADRKFFFVFDAKKRTLEKKVDIHALGLGVTVMEQGPRIFVKGNKKDVYVILQKGIAQLDPKTYEIKLLAESPEPIRAGGAFYNNTLYFVCESHLWSYQIG